MGFRTTSSYARELKSALPPDLHAPATSRLLWLPVHVAIVSIAITAIASGWVPLYVAPLLSLVIGVCFAGLTFLAHETMHGAIVRKRLPRYVVGWLGFLPFCLSPRLWVAWHNRVHHGHANEPGTDPDANPTLAEYEGSGRVRAITDHFAPGRRSWTGFLGLLVGFSVQSAHVLSFAARRDYLSSRQRRIALFETALGVGFWAAMLVAIGPLAFLFAFFLPLVVANAIVMGFIFTNHGLSPITRTNDPLAGTLSVTTTRAIDWVTLGFGFHTEHHLFPGMSTRRAPIVRDLLRAQWPDLYQSMPIWSALLAMHRTARVYRDDQTLFDPRTGNAWTALGGGAVAPARHVRETSSRRGESPVVAMHPV